MTDDLLNTGPIDVEEIAAEVFATLDGLAVEVLWDHCGATRYGYVEPGEEVWEMMEDELQPFLDEAKEYLAKSTVDQAMAYCSGVILGLSRYAKESESEFKGWAEDCPLKSAKDLLNGWRSRSGNDSRALRAMNEFLRQRCSQWVEPLVR